jgi:hypothetical protein
MNLETAVHNRKGAKTPSNAKKIHELGDHPKAESPVLCNASSLRIIAPWRLCGSLFLE